MDLKKFIAVSGLPGLYKLVATKANGLVVADPDSGKTKFCSVRQHQFTPMETVAIYTYEDSIEIADVFANMMRNIGEHPIPSTKASHQDLQDYFSIIIPEYDRDRVFHSDMKKVIKWYNFLDERGVIDLEPAKNDDAEERNEKDSPSQEEK